MGEQRGKREEKEGKRGSKGGGWGKLGGRERGELGRTVSLGTFLERNNFSTVDQRERRSPWSPHRNSVHSRAMASALGEIQLIWGT